MTPTDSDGNFIALDARAGRDLWHVQLGAAIYSAAITFEVDGKKLEDSSREHLVQSH